MVLGNAVIGNYFLRILRTHRTVPCIIVSLHTLHSVGKTPSISVAVFEAEDRLESRQLEVLVRIFDPSRMVRILEIVVSNNISRSAKPNNDRIDQPASESIAHRAPRACLKTRVSRAPPKICRETTIRSPSPIGPARTKNRTRGNRCRLPANKTIENTSGFSREFRNPCPRIVVSRGGV